MKDHLEIYHAKCLSCAYLVEGAKHKYDECHHSNGNTECPAAEVRIVPTGKVRRAERLIKEARARHDPAEEARILKELASESEAFLYLLYQRIG